MKRGGAVRTRLSTSSGEVTEPLPTDIDANGSRLSCWQSIEAILASKCKLKRKRKRIAIFVCVAILVCAAISLSVIFGITNRQSTKKNNVNIIRKTCKNDRCRINSKLCGVRKVKPSRVKRIIGGVDALENSWPWQVSVQLDGNHIAGGSLITDQWVLTAAHVLIKFNGEYEDLSFKIGEYRLVQDDESEREYRVASVHIHPQYYPKTKSYDIAMVKLEEKVDFRESISPVCLPEAESELPPPGTVCYVTGWGATETQIMTNKLREVDVELISRKSCNQMKFFQGYILDDMICAGNVEGVKSSSTGDSGGPLVYLDPENEKWTQIGIANWGITWGEPGTTGVYHRVDISRAWIDKIINEN